MEQLSEKCRQIYEYICACQSSRGYPPSVREIGQAVGLRSPSSVHRYLGELEELGYITRDEGKTRAITLTRSAAPRSGVPILGTVAAGEPILAVEDALGYIPYDAGDRDEYFALRIRGRSMINAGILDGDMVIVRRQRTAESGEIVIALIGDEATCKRLRLDGKSVVLMPENDEFSPIDGTNALILGRVTAVIRTY